MSDNSFIKTYIIDQWRIWLLSILISLPISYFFLKDVHYLKAEIEWEEIKSGSRIYYPQNDEIRYINFLNWDTNLMIQGYDGKQSIINQWIIGGRISHLHRDFVLFEDIDGDSLVDVSFIQIIESQAYLAVIPVNQRVNYYHRYFLDSLHFSSLDPNPIYVNEMQTYQKPFSEKKNIAVVIYAGHARYPRKLYLVDFEDDKVYSSPTDGSCINKLEIADIDGDSLPEFMGRSVSPGNYPDISNLEFHDSSTYMMVFNDTLGFKFPPVETKTLFSRQTTLPFYTDTGNYWLSGIIDNSSPIKIYPTYLANSQGEYIDSIFIDTNTKKIELWRVPSGIYAYSSEGEMYSIKDFRTPKFLNRIKDFKFNQMMFVDIGESEGFFFSTSKKETQIFNSKFELLEIMSMSFEKKPGWRIDAMEGSTLEKGSFLIQDATKAFLLNYKKNLLWNLRFIIVFLFLLVCFILLYFTSYLLSFQQNKRLEREKEITELRFNAMKNQLEPHFLFNSLNSIGHLLLTEDRLKAYSYLEYLSSLLRNTINNASEIAVPISDEVLFTRKYLEIEKLRFEDKFEFEIKVAKNVDREFPVPKMLMQLHTENAVKHGLLHKEYGGKISINIYSYSSKIIIEIEDNGAGRSTRKKTEKNLGKGLGISEQMIDLYQKVMKQRITQEIRDKKDAEGKALGTLVNIIITKK